MKREKPLFSVIRNGFGILEGNKPRTPNLAILMALFLGSICHRDRWKVTATNLPSPRALDQFMQKQSTLITLYVQFTIVWPSVHQTNWIINDTIHKIEHTILSNKETKLNHWISSLNDRKKHQFKRYHHSVWFDAWDIVSFHFYGWPSLRYRTLFYMFLISNYCWRMQKL